MPPPFLLICVLNRHFPNSKHDIEIPLPSLQLVRRGGVVQKRNQRTTGTNSLSAEGGGCFIGALNFSLFLSFVSRQKKEKLQTATCQNLLAVSEVVHVLHRQLLC